MPPHQKTVTFHGPSVTSMPTYPLIHSYTCLSVYLPRSESHTQEPGGSVLPCWPSSPSLSPLRPHVHLVAVLRGAGLELELLADPREVGLPVPAAGQHPLLAGDGLPV